MIYKHYKGKVKNNLNVGMFNKLIKLFDQKGWNRELSSSNGIFMRYVKTLSSMDQTCQRFMMELSERFEYIYGEEYHKCLANLLNNIIDKYSSYNILIARDFQCYNAINKKTKSSSFVFYEMEGIEVRSLLKHEVTFIDNIQKFKQRGIKNNEILVVVDDFVGTGKTLLTAVNNYISIGVNKSQIVIMTIAIMEKGLKYLQIKEVDVFYNFELKRGISDYYEGKNLTRKVELMKKIESNINGLKPQFQFGFEHSEALVCMERCPNNTFPIYWLKEDAPYARSYKKI